MRITTAVIPAAGFGTRFLPATKAQPKEMLTVVDKPVIQYVVEEAINSGIKNIIIITGQSKRAIEDHFDRSFELESRLQQQGKISKLREIRRIASLANFIYIRQSEPLGDGHAILEAESIVGNQPFAMMYGDDIIDSPTPCLAEVMKIYEEFQAPVITVTNVPKRAVSHYGIIGGKKIRPGLHSITKFIEKPTQRQAPSTLANVGRCIITPELFDTLKRLKHRPGSEQRLVDAFQPYCRQRPMYAYTHAGTRYDCGDKIGLLKATVAFALRHDELKQEFTKYLRAAI